MANTRNRGFASMDEQKQREIASKGGKAAHQQGTAHEFTPDEARVAGRKGGESVSRNREHMAAIGRLGGEASRGSRRAKSAAEAEGSRNGGEPGENGNGTATAASNGDTTASQLSAGQMAAGQASAGSASVGQAGMGSL